MKLIFKIIGPVVAMLAIGVSIVSIIGYTNISREIDNVMEVTTQTILEDIVIQMDSVVHGTESMKESLNTNYLRIARSVAALLDENPALYDTAALTDLVGYLGIEEIHIVDEAGVLYAGSVPDFFGFDFHTNDQTLPFLKILEDPTFELAQEPSLRAVDQVLFQYIGVALRDRPGLVQIGVKPEELQSLLETSSPQKIIESYPYQSGAYVYIISPETKTASHHVIADRIGADMTQFEFAQRILQERTGEFTYVYDDAEVYTSFQETPLGIIVAAVPTQGYKDRLGPILVALVGSSATTLIVLVVILLVIVRRTISPLKNISDSLTGIATGEADLTQRLPASARDEIGDVARNFNGFMENLQGLISGIQEAVLQNGRIDSNISSGTLRTEESTEEINSSILEVERLLKEMDAKIADSATAMEQIASNTTSFDNVISSQASLVEESSAAITEMIASLNNVGKITGAKKESTESLKIVAETGKTQIEETSTQFAQVVERISKIQEMANAINDIAAQTNLLSMNAAIEAAHAGDAGRGFAVVAEEIRKLAETAGTSSGTISSLISEITQDVGSTAESVSATKDTFDSILEEVITTVDAFREIELAVHELTTGGQQVMESTDEINRVTEEVNRGSGEIHKGIETTNSALVDIRGNSEEVSARISGVMEKSQMVLDAVKNIRHLGGELSKTNRTLSAEFDQFKTS